MYATKGVPSGAKVRDGKAMDALENPLSPT
jgi:hypothetical protein